MSHTPLYQATTAPRARRLWTRKHLSFYASGVAALALSGAFLGHGFSLPAKVSSSVLSGSDTDAVIRAVQGGLHAVPGVSQVIANPDSSSTPASSPAAIQLPAAEGNPAAPAAVGARVLGVSRAEFAAAAVAPDTAAAAAPADQTAGAPAEQSSDDTAAALSVQPTMPASIASVATGPVMPASVPPAAARFGAAAPIAAANRAADQVEQAQDDSSTPSEDTRASAPPEAARQPAGEDQQQQPQRPEQASAVAVAAPPFAVAQGTSQSDENQQGQSGRAVGQQPDLAESQGAQRFAGDNQQQAVSRSGQQSMPAMASASGGSHGGPAGPSQGGGHGSH